jgi:hypothetical protein
MPIRQRMLELDGVPSEPGLLAPVLGIWEQLGRHGCCPFCGCEVPEAIWPWRYERHNVHGRQARQSGLTTGSSVCMGSRSVYTLKLLGLDAVL